MRQRNKLAKEVKELRQQVEEKASKAAIIDGQQAFFEDLNKVESQVDRKRDEFLMNEFKRLGDKIVAETTDLNIRVEALEKQDREAKLKQMLDQKLDKAEFANFVSLLTEETIGPMQKEIDKSKKDIICIEVSIPSVCQRIQALNLLVVFSPSLRTSLKRSSSSRTTLRRCESSWTICNCSSTPARTPQPLLLFSILTKVRSP